MSLEATKWTRIQSIMYKIIVIFVICLGITYQEVQAESHEAVKVWIFSLYTPQIIKNKTQPFFEYLSTQSNKSYQVSSSTETPRLLARCRDGSIAIVAASMEVGKKLIERCRYKKIAETHQDILLYIKKVDIDKTSGNVMIVGLIKGLDATRIAYSELLEINKDAEAIIYSDFFQLVKSYKE
ncbi:MAG: hypothetical protein ACJAYG_001352, partial [Oceanicoccus sp.]